MAKCRHCGEAQAVDVEGDVVFLFEGEPTVTPCCKEAERIITQSFNDEVESDEFGQGDG